MKNVILIIFFVSSFCSYTDSRKNTKGRNLLALTGIYNTSDCRIMASVYSTETSKFVCTYDRYANIRGCSVVSPPTGSYQYNEKSVIEIKYNSISDFINEKRYDLQF